MTGRTYGRRRGAQVETLLSWANRILTDDYFDALGFPGLA